ncbi:MAG: GDP-mannose 4,6-dehydratase [Planctomycetaceae bacterium]|jgi:UDP-glucuronate 4-epimerase|nr:GDP-mannose 4,6-dehydratase [Phycisphaerales bacterium]MCE2653120.1 GDP-mannose 4,6-dehydratase [Planctomycetaceae bacterium]
MKGAVLLTGAAGFIGSHTAEALLTRGTAVVGIDNFDPFYPAALKRANLAAVEATAKRTGSRFVLIEGDLAEPGTWDRAAAAARQSNTDGSVSAIHLAARAGVRPSIDDPVTWAHVNVVGTAVALEAARRHGLARMVIASSSSVYGNCPTAPFHEELDVSRPISPYAATKRACELIAYTHHALHGTPVAMLRFFTVFGPRQRPDLAINLFMRKIAAGQPIPVFGDMATSRDYTFVGDTVSGILAALERIDRHGYRIWNLGHDHPVRLDEMIAAIGRAVGREPVLDRQPPRQGDVERTWADLTRSRAELGYDPKVSFDDGLAAQWAWMQQSGR